MPARHFSSVLLPEPLRPTIPKNSPSLIDADTSSSARSSSKVRLWKGCNARSLNVEYCWCGILNDFVRWLISTAVGRSLTGATDRSRVVAGDIDDTRLDAS